MVEKIKDKIVGSGTVAEDRKADLERVLKRWEKVGLSQPTSPIPVNTRISDM
jgi:hypothetical protein